MNRRRVLKTNRAYKGLLHVKRQHYLLLVLIRAYFNIKQEEYQIISLIEPYWIDHSFERN